MKLHRTALAAALAASILTPCVALAAGYGIYEQGAAVLGMAGAGTASVHDASAGFYNPAALVRLEGRQVYFGGTWLTTRTSFAGADSFPGFGVTEAMKGGNFYPPTGYWSNHFDSKWAYGVGVNAPFGLGVSWEHPNTFTDHGYVTKALLQSINANLSLAFAATPDLSVAVGYNALFAAVELNKIGATGKAIPGSGGKPLEVRAHLKSRMVPGYGYNAAVLWTPVEKWKFGMNYRSKVDVKIEDGTAEFQVFDTGSPALNAFLSDSMPPKQKVGTTLKFPSLLSLGASWDPTPSWTWEVDANLTGWSTFDQLDLEFAKTPSLNSSVVEDYEDSWRISVGAEHRLPAFTYRFGYYYDGAAAPTKSVSTLLPDANRHGATLGLGWKFGQTKAWTMDVYNLALFVENRSTEGQNSHGYDGAYKSFVNASGFNLAYHW